MISIGFQQICEQCTLFGFILKALLYICEIISIYKLRRSLRSSSQCMLDVPKIKTKKYGARQSSHAVATLWNAISDNRLMNSEHVFCKRLKTCLFKNYFYFSTQHQFSSPLLVLFIFSTVYCCASFLNSYIYITCSFFTSNFGIFFFQYCIICFM